MKVRLDHESTTIRTVDQACEAFFMDDWNLPGKTQPSGLSGAKVSSSLSNLSPRIVLPNEILTVITGLV